MTTTERCQCGAPLVSLVETWIGECSACCAPSLECPYPTDDVMVAAARSANVSALIRRMHPTDAGAEQRAENRWMLGDNYFEDDDPIPGEMDLSTTPDVQAHLVEHQSIQNAARIHPTDAAQAAAHGASADHELHQIGPEPSDVCEVDE